MRKSNTTKRATQPSSERATKRASAEEPRLSPEENADMRRKLTEEPAFSVGYIAHLLGWDRHAPGGRVYGGRGAIARAALEDVGAMLDSIDLTDGGEESRADTIRTLQDLTVLARRLDEEATDWPGAPVRAGE